MGLAAASFSAGREGRVRHLNALARHLAERLGPLPEIRFTGPKGERLPGHVSVRVRGADGASLLTLLDAAGVAASSGSFCGAKAMKASPVLTAMGYGPEQAGSGVVFSMGPDSTVEELDQVAVRLRQCIDRMNLSLTGSGGRA
jgi:cysteine desulfurase